MEPEPVEDCVQNTLSALYPPFAATAPTLLGQVFEVVERTYREDALRYTIEFLIPAKHILARIQQEACAQYSGFVFCHEGWPLCLHEKVVVQLSSLPWQQLCPGDFYLQVAPYLSRAPRLVLKCLSPDGCSVQELPVLPDAYPFLFTAEWLNGINKDRRAGRLERCLLAAEERVLRLPWTELICPQFVHQGSFMVGRRCLPGPSPEVLGARSPGDGGHSGGESQEAEGGGLEGEYVQLLEISPPRHDAPPTPVSPSSQSRTLPARKGQGKGRNRRHRAWLHHKPSREETLPRNRPRRTWEGGRPGADPGQAGPDLRPARAEPPGARTSPQQGAVGDSAPGLPHRAAKGNRRRRKWGGRGCPTSVDWKEPGSPGAGVGDAPAGTKEGGIPAGTGLPVVPTPGEGDTPPSTKKEGEGGVPPSTKEGGSPSGAKQPVATTPGEGGVLSNSTEGGNASGTRLPITPTPGEGGIPPSSMEPDSPSVTRLSVAPTPREEATPPSQEEETCSRPPSPCLAPVGGVDRMGRALLTVTPQPPGEPAPAQGELSQALRYLHSLLRKEQQELGLTVLLDLRQGGALSPHPPALLPALQEMQVCPRQTPQHCHPRLHSPLPTPSNSSLVLPPAEPSPASPPPARLTWGWGNGAWGNGMARGAAVWHEGWRVGQGLMSFPVPSAQAVRAASLYQEVDDAIHRLVQLSNRRLGQLEQERGRRQMTQVVPLCYLPGDLPPSLPPPPTVLLCHCPVSSSLSQEWLARGHEALHLVGDGDLAAERQQLESFERRLESCAHTMHNALRLHRFLQQAQDWALEGVRRLSAIEDGAGPEVVLGTLGRYCQQHGEISDSTFQEMRGLAVQSPWALRELGRCRARCQELGCLLQRRLEVALQAGPPPRRRADSTSASCSPQRPVRGLGTGLGSSRSMSCLLPPPGSLSSGLCEVPSCHSLATPTSPGPPRPSVLIRGLEVSSQEVVDRTCSPREHVMLVRSSAQRAEAPWGGTPSTERKRCLGAQQRLVAELIASEQKYLGCLAELLPLESGCQELPPELKCEFSALEGTRDRLLGFHRTYFLKELQGCASHPLRAGGCFLRYADQFSLYALYVKNRQKLDAALTAHSSLERPWEDTALASALQRPLEQLERYGRFLEELLQETDLEQAPEREALRAAQQLLESQVQHGRNLLAMEQIRGCELELKVQGQLLHRDEFTVLRGRRKCHRHVFLFEQLLLLSKRKGTEGGLDVYVYKQAYKTADMGLTENIGESGLRFELWFRRRKLREAYTLQASSPEVKHKWTSAVAQLLWRQATLSKELRTQEMVSMGIGDKPFVSIQGPSQALLSSLLTGRAARTRASVALSSFSPWAGAPWRSPGACSLPGHLEEEEWELDVKHIPRGEPTRRGGCGGGVSGELSGTVGAQLAPWGGYTWLAPGIQGGVAASKRQLGLGLCWASAWWAGFVGDAWRVSASPPH
uniref:Rho guanine nucleotide exchange factor 40 n=1 Tax=Terrapene triunguis TaxID=2587831 RepID=A0A674JIE9_9SAUR